MHRREVLKLGAAVAAALTVPIPTLAVANNNQPNSEFAPSRYIQNKGGSLAIYEMGHGIPVIFCHGFPELAYSWRQQMAAVAAAGYRAIALDFRGYGLSSKPGKVSDYSATKVCDDLLAIMNALKIDSGIFCGHDWGSFIVDTMNLLHPKRVKGIISIGAPHHYRPDSLAPATYKPDLIDKAAYNDFLQTPDKPEALLNANTQGLFKSLFRNNYFTKKHIQSTARNSYLRRVELEKMILDSTDARDLFVTADTLDFYTQVYQKTGFQGGINWYRAMEISWQSIMQQRLNWEVKVPYLYIWPDDDPIYMQGLDTGMQDYIADLSEVVIKGGNHFVLEQKPDVVSQQIVSWLQDKFPVWKQKKLP